MDLSERRDPRFDCVFEIIHSVGLRKMYDRLNGCENVLCSVFGLPSQSGDLPFDPLAIGDISEAVNRVENVSGAILKQIDVYEHNAARAIGTFDHDLLVLHGIAASENLGHRAIMMLYWATVEMVHAV
jgi:hypothetical protein